MILKVLFHYFFSFFIFFTLGFSQIPGPHPSIHQLQQKAYREMETQPDRALISSEIPVLNKTVQKELTHEIFGYLPYWKYSSYATLDYDLLSTIAYFSAEINANGTISNSHHWPAASLISMAHNAGVRVVLVATLFNANDLESLLSTAAFRTNCVNNLLSKVLAANADGVNIDFEGVPGSQRQNLVTFMQELADSMHKHISHAHISMATPAVDWHDAFNYNALAQICDVLFIMGYGYHWSGSVTAGPVAPLYGGYYNISGTVNEYLTATNDKGEKIVLGVPYYGYKWPTASGAVGALTTDNGSAVTFANAEPRALLYGKLWHTEYKTPWYKYYTTKWYQCWYDDSLSLTLKYVFAKSKELQGIGMWALGYDGNRSELWDALEAAFTSDSYAIDSPQENLIFSLQPNYPNPANPGTTFNIRISSTSMENHLQITIFTLQGVPIFSTQLAPKGKTSLHYSWNGRTQHGAAPPSGVYLYTVTHGNLAQTGKFTFLR